MTTSETDYLVLTTSAQRNMRIHHSRTWHIAPIVMFSCNVLSSPERPYKMTWPPRYGGGGLAKLKLSFFY